ncbi:MAG: Histidine kinase [Solirubrobacterales bacterium]|nr:Histidine kinase [Solirubrobacterales bacterium]
MSTPLDRRGLAARTAFATGLLAVFVASAFAVLLTATVQQQGARRMALHARAEVTASESLRQLLADVRSAERGFVITRQERLLDPWRAARRALPSRTRELLRQADGTPQEQLAAEVARGVAGYVRDYSVPLVRDTRRGAARVRSLATTIEGERRNRSLGDRFDRLSTSARDVVQARQASIASYGRRAVVIAVTAIAGSALLIFLFNGYLARAIARPIRRAAAMAGRLASGELSVRMPESGPGEVRELERSFNTMAGSLERGRDELTASRARVVAAADESRRRIERDLHDGAQQRLISLALELREAETMVPPGHDELRRRLAGTADGVTRVLDELQELSRGIHPASLSDGGLAPALRALARRMPIPVDLDLRTGARLPEPVEVAAYYVASEALANAVKHSHATSIGIALEASDSGVRLTVHDNGVGGADPTVGSGLVGLGDRVEAIGGTLVVKSPSGAGTSLVAELPAGPRPRRPAS